MLENFLLLHPSKFRHLGFGVSVQKFTCAGSLIETMSKYRIKLRILINKPISLSQHGNKELNIGNHLQSIPRV